MRPTSFAAAAGGAVLAGGTRALAAVRRAPKPLHPTGTVIDAELHRHGARPRTGVGWLDGTGTHRATVRLSRAVGLPAALPDIHGLAVRVELGEGRADVLFADTGWRGVTRFLLRPARRADGPKTTLLPYRTLAGPLVLGARPAGPGAYRLDCAVGAGPWRSFATLRLAAGTTNADHLDFDPLLNELPGLPAYDWVRRLREPAYATARAGRDRADADGEGRPHTPSLPADFHSGGPHSGGRRA